VCPEAIARIANIAKIVNLNKTRNRSHPLGGFFIAENPKLKIHPVREQA
jgi:hypothetical protein